MPRWLEALLTPCPYHLRAMGYLRELLGIRDRYRRCRAAWDPHLERTKNVLRQAAARCERRRKAVILGSGFLLDLPLDELAAAFGEVVLVDLVHPLAVRRRVRRLANVRLLAADVSGVAEAAFAAAAVPGEPLPRAAPDLFVGDPDVDLLASVNLLSQLPYLPADYLLRTGRHTPGAVADFARAVVVAHLDYLRRFDCPVAVVADLERLTLDRAGRVVERRTALRGVEFPWAGEEWVWELAPRGETDPDRSYCRRVVGVVRGG
jgi:hypothetical protein